MPLSIATYFRLPLVAVHPQHLKGCVPKKCSFKPSSCWCRLIPAPPLGSRTCRHGTRQPCRSRLGQCEGSRDFWIQHARNGVCQVFIYMHLTNRGPHSIHTTPRVRKAFRAELPCGTQGPLSAHPATGPQSRSPRSATPPERPSTPVVPHRVAETDGGREGWTLVGWWKLFLCRTSERLWVCWRFCWRSRLRVVAHACVGSRLEIWEMDSNGWEQTQKQTQTLR